MKPNVNELIEFVDNFYKWHKKMGLAEIKYKDWIDYIHSINLASIESRNIMSNEAKKKICLDKYCSCGRKLYYSGYCNICDNDE